MRRSLGWALSVALLAPSAWAEAAGNKAAAEALLNEGRRLMQAGELTKGCEKIEASLHLAQSVGTMLDLGDCYEKTGRFASAWAQFSEAAASAKTSGAEAQEELARKRAAQIEPKLPRITLRVPPGSPTQVILNGKSVDPAMFGTPLPIDPGSHTIAASTPGAAGLEVTVDLPSPVDAGGAGAAARKADAAEAATYGRRQRTVAIVVGSLGVVALGGGTYFGLRAGSLFDEAKSHCASYPDVCGPEGVTKSQEAKQAGDISTILFVIGVAGVGGGVALWLTSPEPAAQARPAVGLGVGPGTLGLRGTF